MPRFQALSEPDLPRVLEIERVSNSAPWSEASFRNEINHPHGIFLVAREGTDIVGFGGIWMMVDEAHIINVAVDPGHRRLGIARKLVSDLLLKARELGMVCATLEVRASNDAAAKLYEGLGFKQTAVRRSYYPDNKEDAIVMWLYGLQEWAPSR